MNNKFRVWCKDYNEWEKDPIFLSQDGIPYHFLRGQLVAIKPHNHVIQFFTGLFDADGKAIYDGDIISFHEGRGTLNSLVWFENGGFFAAYSSSAEDLGFPDKVIELKFPLFAFFNPHEKIKVIGNVFDNPELLKS